MIKVETVRPPEGDGDPRWGRDVGRAAERGGTRYYSYAAADFLLTPSPSLIFGMMSVLLVAPGSDDRQRILSLMTGGSLTSLITTPLLGVTWVPQPFVIAHASGSLLDWGLFDQAVYLRILGVLRTMLTPTGLQFVLMPLGGVLLLGEWRQGAPSFFGAGAIVTLTLGVWLASRHEKSESVDGLDWLRGIRLLATSTIGLVACLLLVQWFGIDGCTALLSQVLDYMTVVLTLAAPCFIPWDGPADTRRSAHTLYQVTPGMMWGCAVLILQVSTGHVRVATGFTLPQSGILISTPAEILLPGESRTHKET